MSDYYSDTKLISDFLEMRHDKVLERVRAVLKRNYLNLDTEINEIYCLDNYINAQNKKQPYYKLSKELTLELLKTFTRKSNNKALELIDSMNIKDIRYFPRIVAENQFYNLLKNIFPEIEIHRQFKILNYFVDFYLPDLNLFIEFDEKYHDYNIAEDENRQLEILDFSRTNINKNIRMIRVKEDDIHNGLRKVIDKIYKEELLAV